MSKIDKNYHNLLDKILQEGYTYTDPNRVGVFRKEIPYYTFRHEFDDGFPMLTTKKLSFNNILIELLWFISGDTNIKYLQDNNCHIWDKDYETWCKKNGKDMNGDLGKIYGHYWRNFNGVDQLKDLVDNMKKSILSSELLVVARDPSDKDNQSLPCCHFGLQIVPVRIPVSRTHGVSLNPNYGLGFELHWKQRSTDTFLGLPYNIASYALLAKILEKLTGIKAVAIQGDLKRVHLYDNSIEATQELLKRDTDKFEAPILEISDDLTDLDSITKDMFTLKNYESYPNIKVDMLSRTI